MIGDTIVPYTKTRTGFSRLEFTMSRVQRPNIAESVLRGCRERLYVYVVHPASFCLSAATSLDRFEAVARGERRPSQLLAAAAVRAASAAKDELTVYWRRCELRRLWLLEHLPLGFELPATAAQEMHPLVPWQLPLLRVTFGRITQEHIARAAEVTKGYVCNAEKGRCNLAPRLAAQYLAHVTGELSYVDSAVSSVSSAWGGLEVAAASSGVRLADLLGSQAQGPASLPEHAGGGEGRLAEL